MRSFKSDFFIKDSVDINRYYPSRIKTPFVDNLNEVIFNRFLTSKKNRIVRGYIGEVTDLSHEISKILEKSDYDNKNQLQPIFSVKIGTESKFFSWKDFENKLNEFGIDLENFDRWGETEQFNWVPPIDLDKFINYSNYYWDSSINGDKNEEYITIRNSDLEYLSNYFITLDDLEEKLPTKENIISYSTPNKKVYIFGDVSQKFNVSCYCILNYKDGTNDFVKINSISFTSSGINTEIELENIDSSKEPTKLIPLELTCTQDISDPKTIIVLGNDISNIVSTGTTLVLKNSITGVNQAVTVKSVETGTVFSQISTIIKVEENLQIIPNKISFEIPLLLKYYLTKFRNGLKIDNSETDQEKFSKILVLKKLLKVESNTGQVNQYNMSLDDFNVNFLTSGVKVGDILSIKTQYGENIEAEITSVSPNTLFFNAGDFRYIFSFSNAEYTVVENRTLENYYEYASNSSVNGDFYFDNLNNVAKIFDGFSFIDYFIDYKKIYNLVKNKKYVSDLVKNEWSKQNSWVHKKFLKDTTNKIRARIPIIEYDDRLILSEFIKYDYFWSYRSSSDDTFTESRNEPNLFELLDLTNTTTSTKFYFVDDETIAFSYKLGNLTEGLKENTVIVLNGFTQNDGEYVVDSSRFDQLAVNAPYRTIVKLKNKIKNVNDLPDGSKIYPKYTSVGDKYEAPHIHWRYDGIKNTYMTSYAPPRSRMFNIEKNNSTTTKSGYNWQSYLFTTTTVDPSLTFSSELHDFALFDNYQEGDVRVYINGERQYGNFFEFESPVVNGYVGGITFYGGVTLKENDVVYVEVGPYSEDDAGKGSVPLMTPNGLDLVNITKFRKNEQLKTYKNEYPEFSVVNAGNGQNADISSKIFTYSESEDSQLDPFLKSRVEKNKDGNYIFKQHLIDEKGGLLAYKLNLGHDGEEATSTIWNSNYKIYKPSKVGSEWDIPDYWKYNQFHENKEKLSYQELFVHFSDIIKANLNNKTDYNNLLKFETDYSIGGKIKEHNKNFDIFTNFILDENNSIFKIIEFAKDRYQDSLGKAKKYILNYIPDIFSGVNNVNIDGLLHVANIKIENEIFSDSFNEYVFGDTSAFDGINGIRNFIITLPMIGVVKPVKPYYLKDDKQLKISYLICHDGHIEVISVPEAEQVEIIKKIINGKTYTEVHGSSVTLPPSPSIDEYVIFNDTTIYRFNGTGWDKFTVVDILASLVLNLENKLFEISRTKYLNNSGLLYNLENLKTNTKYNKLEKEYFDKFLSERFISQDIVDKLIFSESDPFSFNYFYTTPSSLPTTKPYNNYASFYKIYEDVFGTPFPNLEPWKIQGYSDKPDWWDLTYFDNLIGKYSQTMWNNILNGIIPTGKNAPNGSVSDGITPLAQQYAYLPVVTDITGTADGYEYGDLLPPYWDSSNNGGINTIRSIFDPNSGDVLKSINSVPTFGQYGHLEYIWKRNVDFIYSACLIALRLDPLNFISKTFGYEKYICGNLQIDSLASKIISSNEIYLHGENNLKFDGINQWMVNYNRYKNLELDSKEFSAFWRDSDYKLAYLTNSIIDYDTFGIQSDFFEMSEKDYSLHLKKSENYKKKYLDSVYISIRTSPSKYVKFYDTGWNFDIFRSLENDRPINFYGVQNYKIIPDVVNNYFTILVGKIKNVGVVENKVIEFVYSSNINPSNPAGLINGQAYSLQINLNGNNYNFNIVSDGTETIQDVVDYIYNDELTAEINGNKIIIKTLKSATSTFNITTDSLFNVIPGFINSSTVVQNISFNNIFYIEGNVSSIFEQEKTATISDSTHFNGNYIIKYTKYDEENRVTELYVAPTTPINTALPPSFTIDGTIIPDDQIKLHSSWQNGTQVYLSTDGIYSNVKTDTPYKIQRINDYSIRLIDSNGNMLNPLSMISVNSEIYVGKLERTFNISSNKDFTFKIFEIDERKIYSRFSLSITGLQNVVDFLHGLASYNYENGIDVLSDDYDQSSGRANSWQLEIENFLDWCDQNKKITSVSRPEYYVNINVYDNTIEFQDFDPNFENGTKLIFYKEGNISVPPEISLSTKYSKIPYYLIKTKSPRKYYISTSQTNVRLGLYINFSSALSGSGKLVAQTLQKMDQVPIYIFNPFKKGFRIYHNEGITSDIFGKYSNVYSTFGKKFGKNELIVNRYDKYTDVKLLDSYKKTYENGLIGGAEIPIDHYQNIVVFSDNSTSGKIIYNKFLGINTKNFVLTYETQENGNNNRPSISGYMIQNGNFIKNIEENVNDLRYYYDYNVRFTGNVKYNIQKTFGYSDANKYFDDLDMTDVSKFTFWKAAIQNKGTNLAVQAFTNRKDYSNFKVDEFYAYKLSEFGGNGVKYYPELILNYSEISENMLKLEFTPPNNDVSKDGYTKISFTDLNRWVTQPDMLRALYPQNSLYFSIKITSILNNAENNIYVNYQNKKLLYLPDDCDGVIITCIIGGENVEFLEHKDFYFRNSRLIEFSDDVDFSQISNMTVATINCDYDSQTPARLVDFETKEIIVKIPAWNPAIGLHNHLVEKFIDHISEDPANYNGTLENSQSTPSSSPWLNDKIGSIWVDKNTLDYMYYYDKSVYKSDSDSIANWGRLAEWADPKCYVWTESTLPPEDYEKENLKIKNNLKVYKVLYKNISPTPEIDSVWAQEKDIHIDLISGLVDENNAPTVFGEMKVYVNGKYLSNRNLETKEDYVNLARSFVTGTRLKLIKPAHVPSEEDIRKNKYKYFTPYCYTFKANKITGIAEKVYYFWVEDDSYMVERGGDISSILDVKTSLYTCDTPYMIIKNLRNPGSGYGIIFGSIFDEFEYYSPYRYTNLIIKNIAGYHTAGDKCILRFTKNYNLRNKLIRNSLQLKNVHSEWKLIRKGQKKVIDRGLWNKVIESVIKYKMIDDNNFNTNIQIPALDRIIFDEVTKSDSRIGISFDQCILDSDFCIDVIKSVLENEIFIDANAVEREIIYNLDFSTPRKAVNTLNDIYYKFTPENVNKIFFAILEESIAYKKEYEDVMKTSWVAVEVGLDGYVKV